MGSFNAKAFKEQYADQLNSSMFVQQGTHKAMVVSHEFEEKMNGKQRIFTFRVIEGMSKDSTIVHRAWDSHSNPTAEFMGNKFVYELCEAVGLPEGFNNESQLFNKPCMITVVEEEYQNNFGETKKASKIKEVKSAIAGGPQIPASAVTSMQSGGPIDDDLPY